jgi:acetoin utilization deacetylase AcuC-like enzyme
MTTLLIENPAGLNHVTPPGHPEQVARLEAVNAALAAPAFSGLPRQEAPLATDADLLLGIRRPISTPSATRCRRREWSRSTPTPTPARDHGTPR